MRNFHFRKNTKVIVLAIVVILGISLGLFFIKDDVFKKSAIDPTNDVAGLQSKLDAQQEKIDELQAFKDEQLKIKQEEDDRANEARILVEKQATSNNIIEKCEENKSICQEKINNIKRVKYAGNFGSLSNIDDANKEITSLKNRVDDWEDDRKTCNIGSEEQIRECEAMVDKRIEEAKDDISEIEKLIKETKKDLEKITSSEECKNYESPCK